MLVNYAGSVTAPDETMYDGDPFVLILYSLQESFYYVRLFTS